jgi:adenylylsulfate kinase-like enzyme
MIYWFTGQPGAGKTTLANKLVEYFTNNYTFVHHIDGDDLRDVFNNQDYSEWGRRKNVERAQDIARYLNSKSNVVVSLVSPFRDQREMFKDMVRVKEIYVHTTDIRGRENYHVSDYEPPIGNFIDIDTTNKTIMESFIEILDKI